MGLGASAITAALSIERAAAQDASPSPAAVPPVVQAWIDA
jgi:hypothetical protein